MLKFNTKFIVFLLCILFVNSVFADSWDDILKKIDNLPTPQEKCTELTKLIQNNHNLTQQQLILLQNMIINLQINIQNNHNLTQQQLTTIQQQMILLQNMIMQYFIRISQPTPEPTPKPIPQPTPAPTPQPTSIYFTGRDKVWHWHSSFDFASITIHHRVKIHTRPSIYAPVRGWTEHEDIFISIGEIQPGPGSVRGWGRPISYKETKDGWINLDQLNDRNNLLWCIAQYDGTVIKYWHWENDVTIFHPEAYCVDPRQ